MEARLFGIGFEAGRNGVSLRTQSESFSLDGHLDQSSHWGVASDHGASCKFYAVKAGRLAIETGWPTINGAKA